MASQHAQRAAYGVVCTIVGYWVVLCAGLGVYLSLLMSETSLSIILTVCVLRLHHAAPGHAAMSPLTATTSPGQVSHHLDRLVADCYYITWTGESSPGQVSTWTRGHVAADCEYITWTGDDSPGQVITWTRGHVATDSSARAAVDGRRCRRQCDVTRRRQAEGHDARAQTHSALARWDCTHYQSCALVQHFQPRFIIFECHTRYRLYNVTTRGLKVIKTMLIKTSGIKVSFQGTFEAHLYSSSFYTTPFYIC